MSGLQGSRWTSNSPAKDSKDNSEEKHVSVPSFGFQLPAVAPSKPAPAPTLAPMPATTPVEKASSPAQPPADAPTEPDQAPEKPLTIAEKAAAATRARMAEIMGLRRRPDQPSSSKQQLNKNLMRPQGNIGKKNSSGSEKMLEFKGKVVEDLMD